MFCLILNAYLLQNSTNGKFFVSFSSPEEKMRGKDQMTCDAGQNVTRYVFFLVYARVCLCLVFIAVLRLRLTLLSAAAAFLMACYNRSRKQSFIIVEKKQIYNILDRDNI